MSSAAAHGRTPVCGPLQRGVRRQVTTAWWDSGVGQARSPALTARTTPQVDVTSVGTVLVAAVTALEDVDVLEVVGARNPSGAQDALISRIREPDAGGALGFHLH